MLRFITRNPTCKVWVRERRHMSEENYIITCIVIISCLLGLTLNKKLLYFIITREINVSGNFGLIILHHTKTKIEYSEFKKYEAWMLQLYWLISFHISQHQLSVLYIFIFIMSLRWMISSYIKILACSTRHTQNVLVSCLSYLKW